MKGYLLNKIEEKEVVTSAYEERLELELAFFLNERELLNKYWALQRKGHLLYPEFNQTCSSLILHLLDLNPFDPIAYNVEFGLDAENLRSSLSFYCDRWAVDQASALSLKPLQLLTDLKIICEYLDIDLPRITKKVVYSAHVYDFIEDLFDNEDLRGRSYFLQQTIIGYRDKLQDCEATSFDELVKYIHGIHNQVHPTVNNERYLIAEIYMDILLVGWLWWLRKLGNNK